MLAAERPGEEIDHALLRPRRRGTRAASGMARPPRPSPLPAAPAGDLAELYEQHTAGVRRHLLRFGASSQDLDDLTQEVFLVLHAKRQELAAIEYVDPWLREVCRRVAAGDRRRAHRRHEIAFREPPETAADVGFEQAIETGEAEDRLHRALDRLDEQSRDLVALHELGSLPLINVAELVDADRKTVRKRLGTALRRLTALLRAEPARDARRPTVPGTPLRREPPRSAEPFRVLALHPTVNVGMIGNVVITVWPGAATLEALELLDVQFERAIELCGGSFAYLTVVEANSRPPNLVARQKIVSMLEQHAHHIRVYAAALQGGAAWIARPIMTGLSLLARPSFPMQFFNGVPAAVRWLTQSHPPLTHVSFSDIVESTERLRRCD
jgi:RNA polymerase sigma-70 factor (ECF subfamily)